MNEKDFQDIKDMEVKVLKFLQEHCEVATGHPTGDGEVSKHIYFDLRLKTESYPDFQRHWDLGMVIYNIFNGIKDADMNDRPKEVTLVHTGLLGAQRKFFIELGLVKESDYN